MGKTFSELNESLREFIGRQQMFFVATAPLSAQGHINLSPKGLESFRVLDAKTVAYVDLTGSGIETVAHVRENGRIAILFCAFAGAPKIIRLHGRGRVVEPPDAAWAEMISPFAELPGTRSVVVVELERIADSCGFGVPLYEYQGQRSQLITYAEKQGPAAIERYQSEHNRASIDGLPGLRHA